MSSPIPTTLKTPSAASVIKPPMSEMHPSKVHNGTMAAPSSALRLGFTDIKPKASGTPGVGPNQSTPSKVNIPSSPFSFQYTRNTNTESTLGPEAQRMMEEIRVQAASIKADLVAQREKERANEAQVATRKIAQPKGKAGRYSEVHMAEFRKMDSIENHPSAFRANPGRVTPAPSTAPKSLKRTQSKANLNDNNETSHVKSATRMASTKPLKSAMKSTQKAQTPRNDEDSPSKRAKQHMGDDASTNRQFAQDDTNIPQPKTPGKDSRGIPRAKTLNNLMSPTQASLARTIATKTPVGPKSILKTPSRIALPSLKKPATAFKLESTKFAMDDTAPTDAKKAQSVSRLDKVMSMFAKNKSGVASTSKPGIPRPIAAFSKTPAPARPQNELPPAPFTTPGKKLTQHVEFTPAPKHAALAQNSPSPIKTGIPRSKANNSVHYPSLGAVLESTAAGDVCYPDLSTARPLPEPPVVATEAVSELEAMSAEKKTNGPPVAVPGNFTFRSDHTIRFASDSPVGFGGSSGQSSVRQVRPSIMPPIPGAFPRTDSPQTATPHGKENVPPLVQEAFGVKSFMHGMSSKKRYRAEDDEEEQEREAEERAVKKMKSASIPEGEALVAPRLARHGIRSPSKIMKKSPVKSRIPAAVASPAGGKRTPGISMSRLAYLAQPKQRK